MKIIVDADACPKAALQACMRLGRKYGIQVWTVASFNHNIQSDHHVTVGSDSQEADLKVFNLAEKGDIVVTQVGPGSDADRQQAGQVYQPGRA